MAKKMSGRLVALSASAVATIYVTGLLSTQSAAQSVAAGAGNSTAAAATPTAIAGVLSTSAPEVVVGASDATMPATTGGYTDGTYSGTGTSRFGNVTASVTIAGGKISDVQITKVTTTFPVSRIASLPAQVLQNQTANVNVVSGATYSSQAFKQAVQQALAQAQAANSIATAA